MKKRTWKLLLSNLGIVIVDIFCFSKIGLDLSFTSSNALNQAASFTVLIMSVILFFYLNGKILFHKEKEEKSVIETKKGAKYYIERLTELYENRIFAQKEISKALEQYKEFLRKKQALVRVMELNNNRSVELLLNTSDGTEASMAENFRQMAARLIILDYDDEKRYRKKYYNYMKERLAKNEEILELFDVLLEEVSRMGDKIDTEDIGLLSAIQALRNARGAVEFEVDKGKQEQTEYLPKLVLHTKQGDQTVYVNPNQEAPTVFNSVEEQLSQPVTFPPQADKEK